MTVYAPNAPFRSLDATMTFYYRVKDSRKSLAIEPDAGGQTSRAGAKSAQEARLALMADIGVAMDAAKLYEIDRWMLEFHYTQNKCLTELWQQVKHRQKRKNRNAWPYWKVSGRLARAQQRVQSSLISARIIGR